MAGWGLCGLLGAALALGTRNAGRLSLAAACGFAGIAYGVLLNFSLMATYGGDLSFQHFLALEARAIPFDAAHAIGNVAFALLAGPAMVRMLVRFRERFEWRRRPAAGGRPAGLLAVLLALPGAGSPPARAGPPVPSRAPPTGWNRSRTSTVVSAPRPATTPAQRSPVGRCSASRRPAATPSTSPAAATPRSTSCAPSIGEVSSSGDLARTIVALEGAGADPRSFAGRDLVDELAQRRADNGSFEGWPGTTSFSAIALRTAGATGGLDKTLSWLASVQNPDGGWGDVPGRRATPT